MKLSGQKCWKTSRGDSGTSNVGPTGLENGVTVMGCVCGLHTGENGVRVFRLVRGLHTGVPDVVGREEEGGVTVLE